jgi:hypothetical protein
MNHRGDQHHPQRRQLRLDEARRLLGERHDPARRQPESALSAARRRLEQPQQNEFTYPVAIYDHTEGVAVAGGFAYHGKIDALRGEFVFGDVNRGRVRGRSRRAEENRRRHSVNRRTGRGDPALHARRVGARNYTSFKELVEKTMARRSRADLHLQSQPRRRNLPDVAARRNGRMLVADEDKDGAGRSNRRRE